MTGVCILHRGNGWHLIYGEKVDNSYTSIVLCLIYSVVLEILVRLAKEWALDDGLNLIEVGRSINSLI